MFEKDFGVSEIFSVLALFENYAEIYINFDSFRTKGVIFVICAELQLRQMPCNFATFAGLIFVITRDHTLPRV